MSFFRSLFIKLTGLLCASLVWASSDLAINLNIGDLQYDQLQLKGIQISLQQQTRQRFSLHIAQAVWQTYKLHGIELVCPDAKGAWPSLSCTKATLKIHQTPWGKQQIQLTAKMQSMQDWQLDWRDLRYAGGKLRGTFVMQHAQWRLKLKGDAINLAESGELTPVRQMLGLTELQGRLRTDMTLSGQHNAINQVDLQGTLEQLQGNDPTGSFALENLTLDLALSARKQAQAWRGALHLFGASGQIYKEPVFFDFKQQPVNLVLDGVYSTETHQLNAHKIGLHAGPVLQLDGAGEFSAAHGALAGRANIQSKDLQAVYLAFVQPWLIGSALDDLHLEGRAALELAWRENQLHVLDASLNNISCQQSADRFAFDNIQADLHWQADPGGKTSHVSWQGGHIGGLDFGPLDMQVQTSGDKFRLMQAVRIPFYQGHIELADASGLHHAQQTELKLSAAVEQVSLAAMSADPDLAWPTLEGQISGVVPGIEYVGDSLTLDGKMKVAVLDGEFSLNQLAVHALTSAAPVLQTDIQIRAFDLAKLTKAFSIGHIQGGLDGEINNLELIGWQPNRFDAHLYSPPDDPKPHRISQRAVDHLTELGQGASAALSTTFLRFFESFAYDRLAIKLSQRGAKANIDGLPHEGGGYYLVKGAGLPRVDVIGHNRQVAWKTLLERVERVRNQP